MAPVFATDDGSASDRGSSELIGLPSSALRYELVAPSNRLEGLPL